MFLHVDAVNDFPLGDIDKDCWDFSSKRVFVQLSKDNENICDLLYKVEDTLMVRTGISFLRFSVLFAMISVRRIKVLLC